MSDSLRDQLLKAGLAKEQDLRKVKSQKRLKRRRGEADTEQDAARAAAAQREADQRARDLTLNRRRQEEQQRAADEHAARQMIMDAEIKHGGDQRFNFTHKGRIRPIYVSSEQRQQLADGKLAIARTRGRYRLVPVELVEKIRTRADFLIAWSPTDQSSDEAAYADHPVPDDLIW